MKYLILIIFGTMSGLASLPVFASENEANDITQVETFTPATLLETAAPNYPRINQRKGQEGWVEVNFMVDPNGKPYDITVADSSQNPHFEKEAIRAVEKFSFEPAQLGATKMDSGAAHRVTFELVDRHGKRNKGARRKFVTIFRKFEDAILNSDQTKAGTLLEKLEAAQVPVGPIYNVADMFTDPHFQARGLFEQIETPQGPLKIPAILPKLSETPGSTEWPGGAVGSHTEDVLRTLGYSDDQLKSLEANGDI